ncbi:MAG: sigma-54-dependent Fis family transcriptional regulator [Deltaproteobacteria bacterium]|nr:sigma-54-dependent Fis family transcriptional regulator [Deltaproteobacteria bacterium]
MAQDEDRSAIIYELAKAFAQRIEIDELIPFVAQRLRKALPASGVSLLLFDEPRNELEFAYNSEGDTEAGHRLAGFRMPADRGVAGAVLRARTSELIANAQNDERHYSDVDRKTGMSTGSMLAVPLLAGERRLGVIEAVRRIGEQYFTPADMAMLEQLSQIIAIALENAGRFGEMKASADRLRAQVGDLRRQLARQDNFSEIVANSPAMLDMFDLMEAAARSSISVLIQGETGAGKELVARAIYRTSDRAHGPFMALNCAAIPDGLIETELFGHRRGAFTGAVEDKQGLLRAASGGVLFLDEIGDMPLAMQAKLLRTIEDNEVTAVGDTRPHKIDVRLLAATNRDLQAAIEGRSFREDLYYRLATMTIRVPPLRHRREDIPTLAALFSERAAQRQGKRIKVLTPEALELLTQAEWPGNVRQLRNEIDRAVAVARDGDAISLHHLSPELKASALKPKAAGFDAPANGPVTLNSRSPGTALSLADQLAVCERNILAEALSQHNQNVSRTAAALGISRITLQKKMKEYSLRSP